MSGACDLLPQVRRPRRPDLETVYESGYLILWELVKKVVIADSLAVMVDFSFAPGTVLSGGTALVAVYAFAIQIHCDFSGYSDIARGCAKMMGFEIRLNFRLPYFATNPVEFWRRWHISLSSWLRDYVYIPLGGNRKGKRRTLGETYRPDRATHPKRCIQRYPTVLRDLRNPVVDDPLL